MSSFLLLLPTDPVFKIQISLNLLEVFEMQYYLRYVFFFLSL